MIKHCLIINNKTNLLLLKNIGFFFIILKIKITKWLSLPFAMTHDATKPIGQTWDRWKGSVDNLDWFYYIDNLLMLTFGGIPWQVYFQVSNVKKFCFD